MSKPLYIMTGGFLGAGKTTALRWIARRLTQDGLRVGLITNDQSHGLVDTRLMRQDAFPVEEITGGCFCCRFDSLVEAAEKLSANNRPDVFLAEPVGSCTDLAATVAFPLRKIYGDDYRVAPLSVLVDPYRAERVLGLEPGPNFSPKVLYVYRKQLEEAELIVINKCDLVPPERLDRLETALATAHPAATLLRVTARDGAGMDAWVHRLLDADSSAERAPDLDYEQYAEGEALLGWLNLSASVGFDADRGCDGNVFLQSVAGSIREALGASEIAHLKMTLAPDDNAGDIGAIHLVRSGAVPELSCKLREPLREGELLVNLRAEAAPELLKDAVLAALEASGCRAEIHHLEHFQPAKPTPKHRMAHL